MRRDQGMAKVTDDDGIKVKGYTVRLAGFDSPEWNQKTKYRFGFWFNHGKRVKRALSFELAGRRVDVRVEGYDRYGRISHIGQLVIDQQPNENSGKKASAPAARRRSRGGAGRTSRERRRKVNAARILRHAVRVPPRPRRGAAQGAERRRRAVAAARGAHEVDRAPADGPKGGLDIRSRSSLSRHGRPAL